MDDESRMIAAAKRKARRMAHTHGITHQQALDRLARDLGLEHWAAFLAAPVKVPRDGRGAASPGTADEVVDTKPEISDIDRLIAERDERDSVETAPNGISMEQWNMSEERRAAEFGGLPFVPTWNALGPDMLPPVGNRRTAYLARIAEILIPTGQRGKADYFEEKGRATLTAFLGFETMLAERDSRTASIPALVDWINEGLRTAGERRDAEPDAAARFGMDAIGQWIGELVGETSGEPGSIPIARGMTPLVAMAPNERSGVIGTMDKGLLPFRNRAVREMTA